jgi:hypothetical protein
MCVFTYSMLFNSNTLRSRAHYTGRISRLTRDGTLNSLHLNSDHPGYDAIRDTSLQRHLSFSFLLTLDLGGLCGEKTPFDSCIIAFDDSHSADFSGSGSIRMQSPFADFILRLHSNQIACFRSGVPFLCFTQIPSPAESRVQNDLFGATVLSNHSSRYVA